MVCLLFHCLFSFIIIIIIIIIIIVWEGGKTGEGGEIYVLYINLHGGNVLLVLVQLATRQGPVLTIITIVFRIISIILL
jgi:hypothetical protein